MGDNTVADTSVHPPRVARLHLELADWLGDDLLESFPCFVVSDRLARALRASTLTGFVLDDVEITRAPEFDEFLPGIALSVFRWLKVEGRAGVDDLGLAADHRLVVSDEVLTMLRRFTIEQAEQSAYDRGAG